MHKEVFYVSLRSISRSHIREENKIGENSAERAICIKDIIFITLARTRTIKVFVAFSFNGVFSKV